MKHGVVPVAPSRAVHGNDSVSDSIALSLCTAAKMRDGADNFASRREREGNLIDAESSSEHAVSETDS